MSVQFDTFAEFVAMGGHGLYVWLAYGSTVVVLLGNFLLLRSARNRQLQTLRWSARAEQEVADQADLQKKAEQEKVTVVRSATSSDSEHGDSGVDVQ
jgi:heme exporter protein D